MILPIAGRCATDWHRQNGLRRPPIARRYTIANVGKATPEAARRRAKTILGAVAHGHDPAAEKATERGTLTDSELADRFMSEHVEQKRKTSAANSSNVWRDLYAEFYLPSG
jgi:hypothetical protein